MDITSYLMKLHDECGTSFSTSAAKDALGDDYLAVLSVLSSTEMIVFYDSWRMTDDAIALLEYDKHQS